MSIVVLNISNNVSNSPLFVGDPHLHAKAVQICEFLLQSLEINRQMMNGISGEWESDEELFTELQKLFNKYKALEEQVNNVLIP